MTALAHDFRKSRREIVRATKSTAMSWLKCQLAFLQSAREKLEHCEVEIFIDTLKMGRDEADLGTSICRYAECTTEHFGMEPYGREAPSWMELARQTYCLDGSSRSTAGFGWADYS